MTGSKLPDTTGSKLLPRNHARDVNAAHERPTLLFGFGVGGVGFMV
jgi:hypothetical protein